MLKARGVWWLALLWPSARAEEAPGWSAMDSARAELEGWQVFAVDGVYEIGSIADPDHWFNGAVPAGFGRCVPGYAGLGPVFDSDESAWRHVAERARGGSALHRRALDFLAAHAPEERASIHALTGY